MRGVRRCLCLHAKLEIIAFNVCYLISSASHHAAPCLRVSPDRLSISLSPRPASVQHISVLLLLMLLQRLRLIKLSSGDVYTNRRTNARRPAERMHSSAVCYQRPAGHGSGLLQLQREAAEPRPAPAPTNGQQSPSERACHDGRSVHITRLSRHGHATPRHAGCLPCSHRPDPERPAATAAARLSSWPPPSVAGRARRRLIFGPSVRAFSGGRRPRYCCFGRRTHARTQARC